MWQLFTSGNTNLESWNITYLFQIWLQGVSAQYFMFKSAGILEDDAAKIKRFHWILFSMPFQNLSLVLETQSKITFTYLRSDAHILNSHQPYSLWTADYLVVMVNNDVAEYMWSNCTLVIHWLQCIATLILQQCYEIDQVYNTLKTRFHWQLGVENNILICFSFFIISTVGRLELIQRTNIKH